MSRLPSTVTVGGRTVEVRPTLIDRLVNWRDPIKGAARYQARLRMAMVGGYNAADRTRPVNQRGWRSERDAASIVAADAATLRAESQDMVRNSPVGGGAIKLNVTKVVGRGLVPKAQIDRDLLGLDDEAADAWERNAEREYHLATGTREIDAERCLPFALLQGLAFQKVLEDGDVLVNLPRFARPGSPYRLKVELIEAARVCNPGAQADTASLVQGVRVDAHGGPATYYVASRHPGSLRRGALAEPITWHELRAFDSGGHPLALLLMDKQRPGQPRGVAYLAPVIELIKQLGRYTDAEVMAAVINGMLTAVVYNDTGVPDLGEEEDDTLSEGEQRTSTSGDMSRMTLGNGSIIGLPAGAGNRIEVIDGKRPNINFDPFVLALLRQIGMALEIPFELLVRHFTSSYSASRAALEEAWDYFQRRRAWLASQLCQPIYEAILTEAIASGRLTAPGFFADARLRHAWLGTLWQGDAPSTLDPVIEIEAARARIDLRLTTRAEERARLVGGDWEASLPQMRREQELLEQHHLTPAPAAVPAPAEQPSQEQEDDAAA